ncbi:Carnosine N-methyltransferase [Geodia barretti]|uniref:Carnosine N-methyltransferase n=1 Tax=Geodia barretti TaxID=519541 RepID=A0AA35XGG5_GEOBA|nr:Carnosine N-methyltransferase [Geodia barretti]
MDGESAAAVTAVGDGGGGDGGRGEAGMSQEMMEEERKHFKQIANSFLHYKPYVMRRVERLQRDYSSLPSAHREMLPLYPSLLLSVMEAVERNQGFVQTIVSCAAGMFENSNFREDGGRGVAQLGLHGWSKVKTTIKTVSYRDWSSEGAAERDMCHNQLLMTSSFVPSRQDSQWRGINPGARGRTGSTGYEIARRGYSCQGNEFRPSSHTIHPWVPSSPHDVIRNQTAPVAVPDLNPRALPQLGLFSMTAGDFLDVYRTPGIACYSSPDRGIAWRVRFHRHGRTTSSSIWRASIISSDAGGYC